MSVKPIFFAIDGTTLNEFEFELNKLKGHIYGVKVGLQLFISEGPKVVEKLKNQGWTVFLDLKLHDIPNTVKEATKSASAIGADYLTIHIASSSEALYEATVNKGSDLKILGVSNALTSKAMSEENGVDGVICPSSEIAKTKELFELIVTPGIRLENEQNHDQKNISTPQFALSQGAKFLVMGRSIRKNLNYIINELQI
jgi:orotidine-5'-phosphate decarboxylase